MKHVPTTTHRYVKHDGLDLKTCPSESTNAVKPEPLNGSTRKQNEQFSSQQHLYIWPKKVNKLM